MQVRYHVFKDYRLDVAGESDEQIFLENRRHARTLAKKRYSLLTFAHDPKRGKLYAGTTNAGGDLLLEFDLKRKKFRSCGYAKSGFQHKQEMKLHKGLWFDAREDALYFATSKLSNIHKIIDTPGGGVVRWRPATRRFELLGRPAPGDYYQASLHDPARRRLYLFSMPGCAFVVFDLKRKRLVRRDAMESVPHTGAIDDAGGVWGTWSFARQAFFRYDPDADRYEFPQGCALPNARQAANVMYSGAGPVDAFINGGDGFLYVASPLGELWRLDPRTKAIEYLCKPFAGLRLPGLARGADGWLYLAGGKDRMTTLARFDPASGRLERLGPVAAPDGKACHRCHELLIIDGTVWMGETDNHDRSGYLWECVL